MENLHIKLNGLSPILMHNPAGMITLTAGTQILDKKKIPTPDEEVKASRYLTPDGHLYVPAIAVRNCLLNASVGLLINKKAAMQFLSGGLLLLDEAFPIYRNGDMLAEDKYSMDVRRAVIQRQGITRVRARIELPWELDCIFGYNSEIISTDIIKTIAKRGGEIVGLLDYRVNKKGWFGRFEVIDVSVEKTG